MGKMAYNTPRALAKIKRIRGLIRHKGMIMRDIAKALPMSERWTAAYLTHMRKAKPKLIYAEKWVPSSQEHEYMVERYRSGSRECAPKPKRTAADRTKRTRQRIYKDEKRHRAHLAKRRAKRIKPHAPDKVTAALFGMNRIVVRMEIMEGQP